MTTNLRRHVLPALVAAGACAALSMGGPAQAMTLPENGPAELVPAGDPTTYSSRAYEEAIAACMTRRGFEYEPYLYTVEVTPMEVAGPGEGIAMSMDTFTGGTDPNERIVAALSVAERIAYHRALNGPGSPLDAQGYPTGRSISISDGSCGGRAG